VRLTLPPGLVPGTYTLRVGMYDEHGVRLANNALDDRALLGTVEIMP